MRTANVLRFKSKDLRCLDKFTLNRVQRDMILEYIEGQMLRTDSNEHRDVLCNIHNLIFGSCQPVKESN
jgi:hypothetical protein